MEPLNELLKNDIENSGYTVYSISSACGINRTTLQHAMNGDRPISRENLNRLLPFLKLTLEEREALETAFIVQQLGKNTYQKDILIKHLLETIKINNAVLNNPIRISAVSINQTRLIDGSINIIQTICQLISNSIHHNEKPFLYTVSPFHNGFFKDLYEQFQNPYFQELHCRHIIPFTKVSEANSPASLFNIQILSNLLPFALNDKANVEFLYYYELNSATTLSGIPFPFYMITNHNIILLSKDCTAACILPEASIEHFQTHMQKIALSSLPLLETLDSPDLLLPATAPDENTAFSYSIDLQPCVIHCIDEATPYHIMEDRIPPEYQQVLGGAIIKRHREMQKMKAAYTAFSQHGYHDFVNDGFFYQVPPHMGRPFTIDERIHILKQMTESNLNGNRQFLMLKNSVFSPNIEYVAYDNTAITFHHEISTGKYRFCTLKEPDTINSFNEFVKNLSIHQYAYTIEDSNDIFMASIKKLEELS